MESKFEIELFINETGREPFVDWIKSLEYEAQKRIAARMERIKLGNFGDHKNLGHGIFELRLDFASGYRIYYGKQDQKIIILLCGGDKKTQDKDIKKAQQYWKIYEQR
jgi:putative addiction module killer protein